MLGLKGAPSALLLSIPYFLFMSQKGFSLFIIFFSFMSTHACFLFIYNYNDRKYYGAEVVMAGWG
ncbi:hypothetical protein ERO13_D03G080950v2 [Gossypium hirsutum]|nr:hypothetical protein ERO13_D03G080950v2 [Gossypium hirsutum]